MPCIGNFRPKLNFLHFLLQIAITIRLLGVSQNSALDFRLNWANICFFCHLWCKNTLAYWQKQAPFGKILTPLHPTNPGKISSLLNVIPPPPNCAINIELFLPFLPDILITQWTIVRAIWGIFDCFVRFILQNALTMECFSRL